jgi:diguanylate cyclase (GGDEF)-like protein
VKPADGEQPRETAGLTMRLIIGYVRNARGEAGVEELLRRAGETRSLAVLENERVWSSYQAKIALMRAAGEVTGEPDVGRRIGSYALDSSVGPSVRLMLAMFGSPTALLRHIPHANAKFATMTEIHADVTSRTSAVIRYRVHAGYTPSRYDCDYTYGLLTQVPRLFELPPARIEHVQCQVDGAPECVYGLSWQARRRGLRRWTSRPGAMDARIVHERLQELQHAVTELVGRPDLDLDAVLSQVAERAAYAVNARAFVLAAHLETHDEPAIHVNGVDPARRVELGRRLLEGRPLPDGEHAIVAPVRSAVRDYGRLAALGAAPFLPAEQELLKAYAALAAAALDALVGRQEAEERRRSAEILLTFAGQVAQARRPPEVVQVGVQALRRLPEADVACILLIEPEGTLAVADSSGFTAPEARVLEELRVPAEGSPELRAFLSTPHEAQVITTASDGPFFDGLLAAVGVRVAGLVGLRCADHVHGLAFAGWRNAATPHLGPRLLDRLKGVGIQTTIGLDKTELLQQVQLQAQTDPLTGLMNRRAFLEELGAAQREVSAKGSVAGLLFLDLDGFKSINDTLGHAAGDALLLQVADRLGTCLGPRDVLARLGGDEFTVLLPAPQGRGAILGLADRILQVMDAPVELSGQSLQIRPSIGAALLSPGGGASAALQAADAAMYAAKTAGGGRVVMAEDITAGAERPQAGTLGS